MNTLVKKAGARRFIVDVRASNKYFFESSIWTVPLRRGLLPSRISGSACGRPELVRGSADVKNVFHQLRIPERLQAFFFFFSLPAVLASEVVDTVEKTVNPKRLAPDFLVYPVPRTHLMGFSWAMFFGQDVTDHCTLAGSADPPLLLFVVTTPHHCSVANTERDPLVSAGQRVLQCWRAAMELVDCLS